MTRPMCNDDDGMLISQVVDSSCTLTRKPFGILLSYYAHGSSKRAIASYYHATAKATQDVGVVVRMENLHWQPVEMKLTTS